MDEQEIYAEEECPECCHKFYVPEKDKYAICPKCKTEFGTLY